VRRNKPANAITNFFVIEENKILLIGYEMFRVYLFARKGSLSKLEVLNQIYNFMLIIINQYLQSGYSQLFDNWLHLQN
jgi:hypothetical protein